jgi:hypothetical protein
VVRPTPLLRQQPVLLFCCLWDDAVASSERLIRTRVAPGRLIISVLVEWGSHDYRSFPSTTYYSTSTDSRPTRFFSWLGIFLTLHAACMMNIGVFSLLLHVVDHVRFAMCSMAK